MLPKIITWHFATQKLPRCGLQKTLFLPIQLPPLQERRLGGVARNVHLNGKHKFLKLVKVLAALNVHETKWQRVIWQCKNQHKWEAVVASVASGTGCPVCSGLKVVSETSFKAKFPERAQYWHKSKNDEISPESIAAGSDKKFWFTCASGHDFEISPNNITSLNRWCPYCAGQKVSSTSNLTCLFPKIAEEWNYALNKDSPDQLRPGSPKKRWWICSEGHEWQATIHSRTQGTGCPYCSNRFTTPLNNLEVKFPEIAEQFDVEKNNGLLPVEIVAGASKSVWWRCKYGHSWKAKVSNRTSSGQGCPKCSPASSQPEIRIYSELKSIDTSVVHRHKFGGQEIDIFWESENLAIEYDGSYYHKEKEISDKRKDEFLLAQGLQVVRIRERPLAVWDDSQISIDYRHNLEKTHVNQIFKHLSKYTSTNKVALTKYLKCEDWKNDELFREIISFLPGPEKDKSLAILKPQIASEWHPTKNTPLFPSMFHPNSGKKVWWHCKEHHAWEASIDQRTRGRGCPYCSNKKVGFGNSLQDKFPRIATFWYQPQNGDRLPSQVVPGSYLKVWWLCDNNHYSYKSVKDWVKGGCSHCPGRGKNRKYTPPKFIR